MASCHESSYQERKLFELLEEQQEPFLLDVYLLESGYSDNLLRVRSSSSSCLPGSACRRLLKLSSHGLKRKGRTLKCLLSKLLQAKFLVRAFNLDCISDCLHYMCKKDHIAKFTLLSSSSCVLDPELSPSSVLELHSDGYSPLHHSNEEEIWTNSTVSTEGITSTCSSMNSSEVSSWMFQQLLKYAYNQTPTTKFTKTRNSGADLSKQLLSDCSREAEAGIWSSLSEPDYVPGSTKKLVDEQIDCWQKQRVNIRNIANLINVEFTRSRSEWCCGCQSTQGEIGCVIEAMVFDDMKTELLLDMLEFHCT